MKTKTWTYALLGTFALSIPAFAKDTGLYLGASIGSATVEQKGSIPEFDDVDFDFDEDDFAYKLFIGYQFNEWLAVEGGYRDFGSPDDDVVKVETDGFDVFGVAGIPLGPLRAFGKLGGIYWESDAKFRGEVQDTDDDGFDFGAGVGVEFEIWSIGLRGEVEYFDVLDDAWMYTIGATVTF